MPGVTSLSSRGACVPVCLLALVSLGVIVAQLAGNDAGTVLEDMSHAPEVQAQRAAQTQSGESGREPSGLVC